jgi:hypothetical protein
MINLPEDQLKALRNLSRKQAGEEVDWISISCARALTDLGYAERNAGGWEISSQGSALLADTEQALRRTPSVLSMTPKTRR